MYLLRDVYNDVPEDIYLFSMYFVYIKDGSLYGIGKTNEKLINSNEIISIKSTEPHLIIISKNSVFKYDNQLFLINNLAFSCGYTPQIKLVIDDLILFREEIDDAWDLFLINFNNEVLWSRKLVDGFQCILVDTFLIAKESSSLTCYNFNNGDIIWQLDFRHQFQNNKVYIYSDLFVKGHKLFLTITDHRRFMQSACIDINNGYIIRQISNFGGIIYDGGENLYVAYAQKIAWLNTTTFDVHVTSLQGFFVENDWYIEYSKSMVKDGLLYFSASEGRGNLNSHIGVLDLNTFDVLWHTELLINPNKPSSPENRYSVRKILVNDKYLGVQTDGNVLHVFEKFNS